MAKEQNPGALPGTEIIFLQKPFAGMVSHPSGVLNTSSGHLFASVEGVQGPLSKESLNNYAESDGMTLFSAEKFGHMAPAHLWTKITDGSGYITDLPLNGSVGSVASGGFGWAWTVLKNGRLVRIGLGGTSTSSKFDPALANTPG